MKNYKKQAAAAEAGVLGAGCCFIVSLVFGLWMFGLLAISWLIKTCWNVLFAHALHWTPVIHMKEAICIYVLLSIVGLCFRSIVTVNKKE